VGIVQFGGTSKQGQMSKNAAVYGQW
jgi:hypothetical protein